MSASALDADIGDGIYGLVEGGGQVLGMGEGKGHAAPGGGVGVQG
jgi:hypothetical protein